MEQPLNKGKQSKLDAGSIQPETNPSRRLFFRLLVLGLGCAFVFAVCAYWLIKSAVTVSVSSYASTGAAATERGRPVIIAAARTELMKKANTGDVKAMINLASEYLNGVNGPKAPEMALHWYKTAAVRGSGAAYADVAQLYVGSALGKPDDKDAILWLRKGCAKRIPEAMNELGLFYEKGVGVKRNYIKGRKWLELAADNGSPEAMANVGFLYARGLGVKQSYVKANECWMKASDKGFAGAMFDLGLSYENGDGVTRNLPKAIEWYKRAAKKDFIPAMLRLFTIYAGGEDGPPNLAMGLPWLQRAAALGYPTRACGIDAAGDSLAALCCRAIAGSRKRGNETGVGFANQFFTGRWFGRGAALRSMNNA